MYHNKFDNNKKRIDIYIYNVLRSCGGTGFSSFFSGFFSSSPEEIALKRATKAASATTPAAGWSFMNAKAFSA